MQYSCVKISATNPAPGHLSPMRGLVLLVENWREKPIILDIAQLTLCSDCRISHIYYKTDFNGLNGLQIFGWLHLNA